MVVGYVETHGRPATAAQLGDLPVVPRKKVEYRGATFEEMDLDAVLARRPAVALVDELAHTNAPGGRHEKRWEDIETLLDAGIDVISTVNVQHLESLNDVVERIAGVVQRETVPDAVVRAADQIELVDMSPEALRRRMAHGNIYPPERVDAATLPPSLRHQRRRPLARPSYSAAIRRCGRCLRPTPDYQPLGHHPDHHPDQPNGRTPNRGSAVSDVLRHHRVALAGWRSNPLLSRDGP